MALNKEVFVMLIFVVGVAGFLTLYITNNPFNGLQNGGAINFNTTGAVTVPVNGAESVSNGQVQYTGSEGYTPSNQGNNCLGESPGLCSGDYKCTNVNTTSGICIATASPGLAGLSDCINPSFASLGNASSLATSGTAGPLSFVTVLENVPTLINAGFQNLALFFSGQKTIPNNPTQCNGVGTAASTLSTFGAVITGQNGNPYTNKNYGNIDNVLAGTLAIAGVFIGLGLLAGLFGAGEFANIIAATGIGVSLILFFQGVFATTAFAGTPVIVELFVDGLVSAILVWIIVVFIRS